MIWIIIFVLLILFIILWDKATKKYVNPYKLYMIFGKKGSGKTTLLTKLAITALRDDRYVYSTVYIPGTILIEPMDITQYQFEPGSLVLIDEVSLIWSNRDFAKFNKDVEYFFRLMRQYKLTVYLFSQTFDIDKKIRDLCDEMYLLRCTARVFSIAKRIVKYVDIVQNANGESNLIEQYRFDLLIASGSRIITFIPRWSMYFNSFDPKQLPSFNKLFYNEKYIKLSADQQRCIENKGYHMYLLSYFYDTFKFQLYMLIRNLYKFPVSNNIIINILSSLYYLILNKLYYLKFVLIYTFKAWQKKIIFLKR